MGFRSARSKEDENMKIGGSYNPYSINNTGATSKKSATVRDYQNYLTQKFGCLTPGKNAAVSVTGGLMRKAMADEKTGAWLERELGKATDYIEAAQKAAISHGSTLKSVSIEFNSTIYLSRTSIDTSLLILSYCTCSSAVKRLKNTRLGLTVAPAAINTSCGIETISNIFALPSKYSRTF